MKEVKLKLIFVDDMILPIKNTKNSNPNPLKLITNIARYEINTKKSVHFYTQITN